MDGHCYESLSCFAHTLQLALKDGLDSCTSVQPVIVKCTKLSNCCYYSALFKEQFEAKFGQLRTVPAANATRWSSLHHQLNSIADLDRQLLCDLLKETGHDNLIFKAKETASLKELVDILSPWAEIFYAKTFV